jgi:hypothetical protein
MYKYKYKYKYGSTYGMKPQRISRQGANVRARHVFIVNNSSHTIKGLVDYLMPDRKRSSEEGIIEKGKTYGYVIPDGASEVNVKVQWQSTTVCSKNNVSFPFCWKVEAHINSVYAPFRFVCKNC